MQEGVGFLKPHLDRYAVIDPSIDGHRAKAGDPESFLSKPPNLAALSGL
jgi:hypothetical protein